MNLKDYAHYYIGCKCFNTWFPEGHEQYDNDWILGGFILNSSKPYCLENSDKDTWTDSIKPILRKLDDITNEECEAYNDIMFTCHSVNKLQDQMKTQAALTNYLLSLHFDLHGLITLGLAIDVETLK
jgi:hypothetical protein